MCLAPPSQPLRHAPGVDLRQANTMLGCNGFVYGSPRISGHLPGGRSIRSPQLIPGTFSEAVVTPVRDDHSIQQLDPK